MPLASCAALLYVFFNRLDATPLAYLVYAVSAYALTIAVARMVRVAKKAKQAVYNNRYARRYLTDIPFRVLAGMVGSFIVNLLFAVLKLATGIVYFSFWSTAMGIYYVVLCVVRLHLLLHLRRPNMSLKNEYREYRLCGLLLVAINLALTGVVLRVVQNGEGSAYPGTLIFAVAAYTFYCIISSVVSVIQYRKLKSPLLSASKAISLVTALVSILTLQTAMFASFGSGPEGFQQRMNIATGSAVLIFILGMAVYMVVNAGRELKKIKQAELTGPFESGEPLNSGLFEKEPGL
ncbi:MAG: hypothetical protein ACK5L3_14165 [Oscillospiraceae bacterium]